MPSLTVVLDHIAGLRQNMQAATPDPIAAALVAELAGADGIGAYLREDRRNIQERDIRLLRQLIQNRLVFHMAPTSEMVGIALEIKPERVVLVPELSDDVPAEKGLDLVVRGKDIYETVDTLHANGINVSVCIAPQPEQAKLAHQLRVSWIQIHAGRLQAARTPAAQRLEFDTIIDTVKMAHKLRLRIAVGHGMDYALLKLFKGVLEIDEFSMGQSIVARALLVGMGEAVREAQTILRHL